MSQHGASPHVYSCLTMSLKVIYFNKGFQKSSKLFKYFEHVMKASNTCESHLIFYKFTEICWVRQILKSWTFNSNCAHVVLFVPFKGDCNDVLWGSNTWQKFQTRIYLYKFCDAYNINVFLNYARDSERLWVWKAQNRAVLSWCTSKDTFLLNSKFCSIADQSIAVLE